MGWVGVGLGEFSFVFRKKLSCDSYRGFILKTKDGTVAKSAGYCEEKKKLCLFFGNVDRKLPRFMKTLMEIPVFEEVFQRWSKVLKSQFPQLIPANRFQDIFVLKKLKFDPNKLLTSYDENSVVHQILGCVIVQMGIYEILKTLKLRFEGIFGISTGILTVSYAKQFLTFEETVVVSYFTSLIFNENARKIEYDSDNNDANDKKLQEKMTEFLKQTIANKNNRKLNVRDEEKFVEFLVDSLLNKTNLNLKTPPRNVIVLECGSRKTNTNSVEVMKLFDTDAENGVEGFLLQIGK